MKKIILFIITIIGCSLVIYVCTCVRSESKRNEIKNEMCERLAVLVQQTNTITAAEYTPFLWDSEYSYDYPTTKEEFNALIEDKEAKYLYADEKEYREIYFYNDTVAFDTGVMRANYWSFWYQGKIVPENQLTIDGNGDWIDILLVLEVMGSEK